MNTTKAIEDHQSAALNEVPLDSGPLYVSLTVDDPECLEVIREYEEGRTRNEFIRVALKIGVLAIKHARGRVDGEEVRRQGEHLLTLLAQQLEGYRTSIGEDLTGALKMYFDPKDGRFNERVERFLRQDGDLAQAMQQHVQSAESSMREVLTQHLGENSPLLQLLAPGDSNQFLAGMRETVDGVLGAQKVAILREFSLDHPESALSRLLREVKEKHGALSDDLGKQVSAVIEEFSLDREDSALSRLVKRVDDAQRRINNEFSLDSEASALYRMRKELLGVLQTQQGAAVDFQQRVLTALEGLRVRKEEAAKSTRHGHEFHADALVMIRRHCEPAGDLVTDVGTETGLISRSKVGDALIELNPDCAAAGARIVVETKENAAYSMKSTLEEIDLARKNRGACVGLFVHSKKTAAPDLPTLHRHGNDVVVVWDAEDESSDIFLKAGLLLSKALAVREAVNSKAEAASAEEMQRAMLEIEKQVKGFEEIKTKSATIMNAAKGIDSRAEIMQEQISKKLTVLTEHLAGIKGSGESIAKRALNSGNFQPT